MRKVPRNIFIKFGSESVMLADANGRATTPSGVEIYLVARPANNYKPMACCPDGTLEQHKHDRPIVTHVNWVDA